jgi:hypothetical protein
MLTALPPSRVTAIEDDRPIVIGRVGELDFYLLAHEAKNQGYHCRAHLHLIAAAALLGIPYLESEGPLSGWELNVRRVDEAWAKRRGAFDA